MNCDLKVIVIGQSRAGKTSLIQRFLQGQFCQHSEATIGMYPTKVESNPQSPDKNVRYMLWDTGGAERYRSLWSHFYRGAQVALLVYDVSEEDSFHSAWSVWRQEVQWNCPGAHIIMVGNKTDRWAHRVISTEEGARIAKKNGHHFCETSAKTGKGVDRLFWKVATILDYLPKREDTHGKSSVRLTSPEFKRTGSCCPLS